MRDLLRGCLGGPLWGDGSVIVGHGEEESGLCCWQIAKVCSVYPCSSWGDYKISDKNGQDCVRSPCRPNPPSLITGRIEKKAQRLAGGEIPFPSWNALAEQHAEHA